MSTFMAVLVSVCLMAVGIAWILIAMEAAHRRRVRHYQRRDPAFFTDQHVEERRKLVVSFQDRAAKGFHRDRAERVAGVITPPTGKAS